MQRKVMVTALVAVTAIILAMPLAAQEISFGDDLKTLKSNTNASTAGIYGNDVDNFINYHKFDTVLKDGAKWFGFVTGRTIQGGVADLGYATNLGGIYLGVWYRGNIAYVPKASAADPYGDTFKYYEQYNLTPTYNANDVLTQTEETTVYLDQKWLQSANKIEFLIGVAGQGIKVGFAEAYQTDLNAGPKTVFNNGLNQWTNPFTVIDYKDGRKDYYNEVTEYRSEQGNLKPYLGWGTNIAIGDMNLMPYVDLGLTISNDISINNYQNYTEVNGAKQNVTRTVGNGNNNGKLTPDIQAGAKLDLAKKGTTVTQLGLKYNAQFDLYSNDYSASGVSGTSNNGTVSWSTGQIDNVSETNTTKTTVNSANLTFDDRTKFQNTITPSYKITGEPFENFKLGFSAGIPVTFGSESENNYSKQITTTKTEYKDGRIGNTREYEKTTNNWANEFSNFEIGLKLNFGASYKLIPDRFTINAGIGATPLYYVNKTKQVVPTAVKSVTTDKTKQDDGSVTQNDKTVDFDTTYWTNNDNAKTTDSWDAWSATLYGGFVFNFSPKAALDLGIEADSYGLFGGADTFNLNLANVNVIFTFKF